MVIISNNISLLKAEEVKTTNDKSVIGKPFLKYQESVKRINLIEWAKQEIGKRSSEKIIVVKVADLAKEMGPEFEKIRTNTLYSALRYILFYNGLTIGLGHHKDGDEVFTIKEKDKGDKLPQTYKNLEERAEKMEIKKKEREEKALTRIEEKRQNLKEKTAKIDFEEEKDAIRERIRSEKKVMFEEFEKERHELNKEKLQLSQEIDDLNKIIADRFGENIFLVEIFQFNWKTLSWKLIKRKSAKNYPILFDLISEYLSSVEDRYRFEFTSIQAKEEKPESIEGEHKEVSFQEKEIQSEVEAHKEEGIEPKKEEKLEIEDHKEVEVKPEVQYAEEEKVQYAPEEKVPEKKEKQIEKEDKEKVPETVPEKEDKEQLPETVPETVPEKEEKEEKEQVPETVPEKKEEKEQIITAPALIGNLECPRCGSKNIKTWPTVQVIRTRSGERKLRHRCQDCNETFGDEDLPKAN